MTLKVVFRPKAEADLFRLYDYIAARAGVDVAGAYIARIETACLSLTDFPNGGTKRDDIRPGLRTVGFERRVTIAFIPAAKELTIVRVFYGGQDFERRLRGDEGGL